MPKRKRSSGDDGDEGESVSMEAIFPASRLTR